LKPYNTGVSPPFGPTRSGKCWKEDRVRINCNGKIIPYFETNTFHSLFGSKIWDYFVTNTIVKSDLRMSILERLLSCPLSRLLMLYQAQLDQKQSSPWSKQKGKKSEENV
jgi:hypothetical protein